MYKLHKALYGLKQAPRAWYDHLKKFLLDDGFVRGVIDPTLFTKSDKGDLILCQIYVDVSFLVLLTFICARSLRPP